ncbi:MAG: SDR family oxidoreductase [Flavobacteriales bacterium]
MIKNASRIRRKANIKIRIKQDQKIKIQNVDYTVLVQYLHKLMRYFQPLKRHFMMKKNVIVTGAGRGIGYETVKRFVAAGHKVLAVSRDVTKLSALVGPGRCLPLSLDLTDASSYEKIRLVVAQWQKLDILINNAGYLVKKPFEALTTEDFEHSYAVNVFAPVRMIQLVRPCMGKKGHVLNISSMGGVQSSVKFPGLAAYSITKAALCNLTELLAEEFKETGPSVNCLALGAVQTEMLEKAFPGYKSTLSAQDIAGYIYRFSLEGDTFYNGKILPVSSTTP